MKIRLAHYLARHATQRAANAGRNRTGGKRRHYSVPIGNRTEALQSLEELFDVNEARFSPNIAVY